MNKECSAKKLVVKQNVRVVKNLLKWTGSQDWNLFKLFDKTITKQCADCEATVKIYIKDSEIGKLTLSTNDIDGNWHIFNGRSGLDGFSDV